MKVNTTISEALRQQVADAGFKITIEPVARQAGNQGDHTPIGDAPILTVVDMDRAKAYGMDPLKFINGGQSFRVAQQNGAMRRGLERGRSYEEIITHELNIARSVRVRGEAVVNEDAVARYLAANPEFAQKLLEQLTNE